MLFPKFIRSGGDVRFRWFRQLRFGRLDSHAEAVNAFYQAGVHRLSFLIGDVANSSI